MRRTATDPRRRVLLRSARLGTCLLARERGRIAALIGSVLTVTGGVMVAGSAGFAALTWFATSDGRSEEARRGPASAVVLARAKAVPLRRRGSRRAQGRHG